MLPDGARSLAHLMPDEPPTVTAYGIDSAEGSPRGVKAALLVWGRYAGGWAAGICWPYSRFRGSALRALMTMWVPEKQVEPRPGEDYSRVPRITVSGRVSSWPVLPPAYPRLPAEWRQLHLHAVAPDPTGEYLPLREAMRDLNRRR